MATNYSSRSVRGMSIIELLVYISILTFLTVVVMNSLASLMRTGTVQYSDGSLARSAVTALNRLNREIVLAEDALVVGDTLTLLGHDSLGNSRMSEFYLSNGEFHWREDGVDRGPLNENGILVQNAVFDLTTASSSIKIRTILTLNGIDFFSTNLVYTTQ